MAAAMGPPDGGKRVTVIMDADAQGRTAALRIAATSGTRGRARSSTWRQAETTDTTSPTGCYDHPGHSAIEMVDGVGKVTGSASWKPGDTMSALERDVMSPREVAERAGFSYHAILRAIRRGDLQAFEPVPGQYRIELREYERWLHTPVRAEPIRVRRRPQNKARALPSAPPIRAALHASQRSKEVVDGAAQAQRQVAAAVARGRP